MSGRDIQVLGPVQAPSRRATIAALTVVLDMLPHDEAVEVARMLVDPALRAGIPAPRPGE